MVDPNYIGKTLDNRLHEVQDAVNRRIGMMTANHASKGALNSGATIRALGEIAIDVAKSFVADACKFAFEYIGTSDADTLARLQLFTGRVKDLVYNPAVLMSGRLGLNSVANDHMRKVRDELDRITDQLLADFEAGMHGSERLKKDNVVNAVINQSNSPGAVAQVGAGTFSQTAFTQQQQQLIGAIDQVLASPEFLALKPEEQEGFRDIADVVKSEAAKPNPDTGKLQRWGARLVEFSKEVGLSVGSGVIAEVLLKIFGA